MVYCCLAFVFQSEGYSDSAADSSAYKCGSLYLSPQPVLAVNTDVVFFFRHS